MHVLRPSLGDIVSFSYDVKTRRDMPTRPCVYRIRTDLEWDDVITSVTSDKHRSSGKPAGGREWKWKRFDGEGAERKGGRIMHD